jgi:translocation and assembly module TamB
MPVADEQQMEGPQEAARRRFWPRRWRSRIGAGVALVALIGGTAVWLQRERIAGNVIDDYLESHGVPATYDIVTIGPKVQVIENLVVGDPARPDLTVRRMVVEIGVGWTGPMVDRVTIEGARAFGSYRGGTFSLGALDPLIFTDSAEPPALPAINVTITDARALLESDFGRVGLFLAGAGRLDDGFAGALAASAPGVGVDGCRAERATLYGKLTTDEGAAKLAGPLRLADVACGGATLARADIGTLLALKPDFSGAEGDLRIEGSNLAYQDITGTGLRGTANLTWGGINLAVGHDLALTGVSAPQGRLARLSAEGAWRGASDASRGQWEGNVSGAGLVPGTDFAASLAAAERGTAGTLLAPLIAQARGNLSRALGGASFESAAIIRHKAGEVALIAPEAVLSSRGGAPVVALSQISARIVDGGLVGLRGNVLAGGEGLPNINSRMEQAPDGAWTLRMAMAEYRAGANRLAIPRLAVRQSRNGAIGFDGLITASGDLPGGGVNDLTLPVEGSWSSETGLAAGRRCIPLRFAALSVSGLALERQAVTLCPDSGAAMLRYRDTLTLAARTGALELAGTLGESPARLSAERVVLRYPAPFALEGVKARIGAPGSEVRLAAASISGSLSGAVGGQIADGSAQLEAVPFDLSAINGRWVYRDGALRLEDGSFALADRPAAGEARFTPLAADGAALTLADNRITANATLRHSATGRTVADVTLAHNLSSASGGARFTVPGLAFDQRLQPEDLSPLAQGVIAFADGSVRGNGLIDWNPDAITSSGTFGSDGLDFAAAFGPVRGLYGDVVFTDLLNLTTAPDQMVTIAAINPGIEVLDGRVRFDVADGTLLRLKDARFPFMGGTLALRPLAMDFSKPEERRYVFEITGLDAATFVAQMELTNLGATGTFDGTVPIVFDASGNGQIEGGLLIARAPGGNIAYVGELTYENLGAMGNYAFQALRSLDYRQMSVGLNGNLAGEIVTNFDFDGVRQGAGTSQNFVTRRLAKLPIRFKVNVRSENFYQLATMIRSFWDIDFLGNPVERGLLKAEDGRFVPANPRSPSPRPTLPGAIQPVQPAESQDTP